MTSATVTMTEREPCGTSTVVIGSRILLSGGQNLERVLVRMLLTFPGSDKQADLRRSVVGRQQAGHAAVQTARTRCEQVG